MVRFFRFLGLWSLYLLGGLAAVALATWAASRFRSESLVTAAFLVVGVSSALPISLAVASSRVYPARPGAWSPDVCPHCGGSLPEFQCKSYLD